MILGIWAALICSTFIAVVCMMLGGGLLYRGTSLSASPLVLCCVTGLLIGIAMLVVLPQAFESLLTKDEWPAERIFALFVSAPLIMFFLEHVIIDHEHVHAGGPAGGPDHTVCDENCDHGPNIPYAMKFPSAKEAGESTPLQPAEKEASGRCLDFGCAPPPPPLSAAARLVPSHSNPALTSTEPPPRVQAAAATLCVDDARDVGRRAHRLSGPARGDNPALVRHPRLCYAGRRGALYLHQLARGYHTLCGDRNRPICRCLPHRSWHLARCLQGAAPPPSGVGRPEHMHPTQHGRWRPPHPFQGHGMGAEPKPCLRSRQDKNENALVLDVLRCVMAGLFVYMALFELAPPHAHGRGQNLKYFIAFSVGLISAYMADMFEDSMHSHQSELVDWISRG